jgi:hypothetical protein
MRRMFGRSAATAAKLSEAMARKNNPTSFDLIDDFVLKATCKNIFFIRVFVCIRG